jgi:hypothetical protein
MTWSYGAPAWSGISSFTQFRAAFRLGSLPNPRWGASFDERLPAPPEAPHWTLAVSANSVTCRLRGRR